MGYSRFSFPASNVLLRDLFHPGTVLQTVESSFPSAMLILCGQFHFVDLSAWKIRYPRLLLRLLHGQENCSITKYLLMFILCDIFTWNEHKWRLCSLRPWASFRNLFNGFRCNLKVVASVSLGPSLSYFNGWSGNFIRFVNLNPKHSYRSFAYGILLFKIVTSVSNILWCVVCNVLFFTNSWSLHVCTFRFNAPKFCGLPAECIYVLCVDFGVNYLPMQH